MFDICVPVLGPNVNGTVPNSTGPSNNLTATLTEASLGLYTPTLVRDAPFINPGNTVTGCAAEDGSPGMNIPTAPPVGNGEYNRDVTTTVPAEAELVNSTAPNEFGVANKLTQISSKDFASRGANVNVLTACDPNRYTAVTATLAVYDVLNTRTSERNGATPCTDAATGSVTMSARRTIEQTERKMGTATRRMVNGPPGSILPDGD
jgi:hypothetical protein